VADPCEMVLLVQAEFDCELDAAQAANLQTHRAQCPDCQAAKLELVLARGLLREVLHQLAPDALRDRILAGLDAGPPTPALDQFWRASARGARRH
jgi:hypothetical protein